MEEFLTCTDISDKSFEYAKEFNQEKVFANLIQRKLPGEIDKEMWGHIKKFNKMKKRKEKIKNFVWRARR